jgi:hypothetical protein
MPAPPPEVLAAAAVVEAWTLTQEQTALAAAAITIVPGLSAMDRFKAMGARPDKPVKHPDLAPPPQVEIPRYGRRQP